MANIQQTPVDAVNEIADTNSNGYKVILAIAILIIFGAGFYAISSWQKEKIQKEALKRAEMQSTTFAPKGYENYVSVVNNELATKDLSEDTKNMLLLKKAIVMIDAVEPDEKARDELRVQAGGIFRGLYETSTDEKMKAYAVLGFLLDFNQRFFLNGNTRLLPSTYRDSYMELYQASTTRTVTREEFQRLAFQTFIKLAHDPSTNILEKDRTFLSNRMYITAIYLASFHKDLPKEEKDLLLADLKKDVNSFDLATNIIFTDDRHTKLVADFYYAYAYGVYTILSQPSDLADQLKIVAQLYENARKNVQSTGDFLLTNITMGQYIDTYYLSFLTFSKIEGYQTKISEVLQEMNTYAENQDARNIVIRFYNDFLNTRGTWISIRKNLILLKSNKEYTTYLNNLGVVLK